MNQQPTNNTRPNFGAGMQQGMHNVQWNDQDIITDLLSTEKWLSGTYATNITECSCANLRRVLLDNFASICNDQYQLFDQMRQRNWYPVKNAQPQEVQAAKQQFAQMKTQIM